MDIKILEKIGLTESEIKVYFSLMKIGSSSTGPIIKESQINHSKIYLVLDKLESKGLVSHIIQNNVRHYKSTDPSNFLEYIKIKKREIEEQENQIELLIPQLREQQKLGEDFQEATVYSGINGVKSAFNLLLSVLEPGDEYFVLTNYEESTSEALQAFFLNYHLKRIDKKIKAKLLTMTKFKSSTSKKYPNYKYSERRYVDIALPTGVYIFGNYVMHFIWSDNPTVFLIKSRQNSNRYIEFFMGLWEKSKK